MNDHVALGLFAFGLAPQPSRCNRIVNDLALERVHRRQRDRFPTRPGFRCRIGGQLEQLFSTALPETRNIEHQPAAIPGLGHHGQPGQLLQGIQNLSLRSHQNLGMAHNRHVGSITFDVGVDVTVQIGDIQQFLEIVRRDLGLTLQWVSRSADSLCRNSVRGWIRLCGCR